MYKKQLRKKTYVRLSQQSVTIDPQPPSCRSEQAQQNTERGFCSEVVHFVFVFALTVSQFPAGSAAHKHTRVI